MSDLVPSVVLENSLVRSMTAKHNGRVYEISIAWPAQPAPVEGFPALFVVDAQSIFGSVVESVRTRSARTESTGIVPAVVVGISVSTSADELRLRRVHEFTMAPPAHQDVDDKRAEHREGVYGGALSFLDIIRREVQPAIVHEFPVDVTRQTLIGHSLGALFVVETLLRDASAFNGYVALSPSIWWDAERLLASARALPLASRGQQVSLSVGEYEEALAPWQQHRSPDDLARITERRGTRAMIGNTRALADALARAAQLPAQVSFDLIAGEDHASMVPAALSRALRTILRPR